MNKSSNKNLVPEAKEALEKFKMEAANEVGVNLNQSYNGDITARQAGSVGGQMVNIMTPARSVICTRKSRVTKNHTAQVRYVVRLMG